MSRSSRLLSVILFLLLFAACDDPGPFRFETFALRDGALGHAYADTIYTAGSCGHVAMTVTAGQLPPGIGLRVEEDMGILHGQPARTGDFQFTVQASDSVLAEGSGPPEFIIQGFALAVDSL